MATNNAINTDTNSFCKTANNLSDVATPATARLNLYVPLAVNSATVLTASDYGKEVVCTGAAAYALTLPTVVSNANKFIDIFCQTTSNALVTVTPASGTISGQSTIVLGSGDGIRVQNDGTNWWVLSQWLQPVNFSASLSATQSIADSTSTTIVYNQTDFNVGSFLNTGTGIFTPLLPGKYQIEQNTQFQASATATYQILSTIQKNGVSVAANFNLFRTANWQTTLSSSAIVSLNGSTDAIRGRVAQTSGGNLLLDATSTNGTNRMWGSRLSLF